MWVYNVSCAALLIALFKLFYASNHNLLYFSSLSPAPAPAETTSEDYCTMSMQQQQKKKKKKKKLISAFNFKLLHVKSGSPCQHHKVTGPLNP